MATPGFIHDLFKNSNDPFGWLAADGRMWRFSGAALNTTATGATSFATTTATFILAVDAAVQYAVIPAEARIFQAGTVAGGAVTVLMEIDNADRYTSGGTAMLSLNTRTDGPALPSGIAMYDTNGSAIVSTNAVGIRTAGYLLGQDVSPAEGAVNEIIWTPQAGPDFLVPTASVGASWIINTSAATTGPTWFYSFKAAVVPLDWMGVI
jgi:hypothetical protein